MSANINRGRAEIDNENNKVGNTVTLTAYPDVSNGIRFKGWNMDPEDDTNFISTSSPYTFTIDNDNQGTYYAHFTNPPEKSYVRIQNKKTGRFLSLYGDAYPINHTRSYKYLFTTYNNIVDGFKFGNDNGNFSFKMISASEAQGNPTTVFLRSGEPGGSGLTTYADLTALGVSYQQLVSGENNPLNDDYLLNFEYNNGTYRIYIPSFPIHTSGGDGILPSYLCDEGKTESGKDYPVMKTIADLSGFDSNEAEWYVYVLDENTTDGAFGANTKSKFTSDGKYYTTMYTDFPYKLLDDVKAYILPISEESVDIDNAQVKLPEIDEFEGDYGARDSKFFGIVPANTAVILECPDVQNGNGGTTGVKNRLLPLTGVEGEPVPFVINPAHNALKGYISLNGNRVTNDKDKMYVLSSNKDVLGFYHSSSASMTPFKAYLDFEIPEEYQQQANSVKYAFGDKQQEQSQPTVINMWETSVDDDSDYAIYDLNGHKVAESGLQRLPKGVYIQNGKKYVVK